VLKNKKLLEGILIMSTTMSKIKLLALGCLSITALAGTLNISSASAQDYSRDRSYGMDRDYGVGRHEDVRGYENIRGRESDRGSVYHRQDIYRRDDGFYQVNNQRRLCLELRQSISALERTREALLRRHHYNPERLRWIERELRQKRLEYRRACR
jgi:hypothetical protein